jgi:integrase/recombinase XerC/integrase/recombinase XerD
MTLWQALDSFILDQQLKGNTDKTIRGYRGFVTQFIKWVSKSGFNDMNDVTLLLVNKYQLYIDSRQCDNKKARLTRRTVRTYMRNIRVYLAFCFAEGYINEPIHSKMKLPKAEKPVIEILTDEEVEYLLHSIGSGVSGRRNRAMICLMLDGGLRLSEVTGIKASDINFDRGYIKIMGKGRKERIVPIGLKVCEALREYILVRPAGGKCLFLSIHKTQLTPGGLAQLMKHLKHKTGISRLHAHLLRHTFATNYLIHGFGDVYELSRILGHSDIRTTEGYVQLASYYKLLQNRHRQTYLDMKEAWDINKS